MPSHLICLKEQICGICPHQCEFFKPLFALACIFHLQLFTIYMAYYCLSLKLRSRPYCEAFPIPPFPLLKWFADFLNLTNSKLLAKVVLSNTNNILTRGLHFSNGLKDIVRRRFRVSQVISMNWKSNFNLFSNLNFEDRLNGSKVKHILYFTKFLRPKILSKGRLQ